MSKITIANGKTFVVLLRDKIKYPMENWVAASFAKHLVPKLLDLTDLLYKRIDTLDREVMKLNTLYADLLLDTRIDDKEPPGGKDG